jgi:hypothetical protein
MRSLAQKAIANGLESAQGERMSEQIDVPVGASAGQRI